jgi:hypothetical protein
MARHMGNTTIYHLRTHCHRYQHYRRIKSSSNQWNFCFEHPPPHSILSSPVSLECDVIISATFCNMLRTAARAASRVTKMNRILSTKFYIRLLKTHKKLVLTNLKILTWLQFYFERWMRTSERLSTVSLPPVANIRSYVRSNNLAEALQSFIAEKICGFSLQKLQEQLESTCASERPVIGHAWLLRTGTYWQANRVYASWACRSIFLGPLTRGKSIWNSARSIWPLT